MKRFKKLLSLIILAATLITLCACESKYKSSYTAIGFSHYTKGNECGAKFMSLNGTFVFKLNYKGPESALYYDASIESGTLNIYYDYEPINLKQKLFTAEAGYPIEGVSGYVERGTVYIILEADDVKNGSVNVRIGE